MIIRNVSAKIVHVGSTMLLPDASFEADEKICGCAGVKAMERKGLLKIEGEPAKAEKKPAKADDKKDDKKADDKKADDKKPEEPAKADEKK